MSIIIDANRTCDFEGQLSPVAREIVERVLSRQIRITVGGELLRELTKTKMRRLLTEWSRIGALRNFNNFEVDNLTVQISGRKLKSDDPHILALAIISGTRLLFSDDVLLVKDFKNPQLISPKGRAINPRSKIAIVRRLLEEAK